MVSKISILRWLTKSNKKWYERDIASSLAYVNAFKEPVNLWQRSFYQYKCYRFDVPLWKRGAYSIGACLLLPVFFVYFRITHHKTEFIRQIECIGDCFDVPEMLPNSLKRNYQINSDVYNSGYTLSSSDVKYIIKNAVSYWRYPSFILHIVFKIAAYSSIFEKYHPSVLVCHNEYSYSSSALTDYCRCHNVSHINFMHGERLINIRNAFFTYDKCYVWHEHYKRLYLDLRSGTLPEDFIIEMPDVLKIDVPRYLDANCYSDYKYYLAEQSYDEMVCIVTTMNILKGSGLNVIYRPHPRYTDVEMLRNLVRADEIEYPREVDIRTSIASCQYAIGSYSTVLLQAYLCGKGVLIDDITYKDRIELQRQARHILLFVDGPELLSCHINEKINGSDIVGGDECVEGGEKKNIII